MEDPVGIFRTPPRNFGGFVYRNKHHRRYGTSIFQSGVGQEEAPGRECILQNAVKATPISKTLFHSCTKQLNFGHYQPN